MRFFEFEKFEPCEKYGTGREKIKRKQLEIGTKSWKYLSNEEK